MIKLFKQMSVYGIGGALSKSINFLLLPVYTRLLTTSDYGELELTYIVGSVAGILYGFMITSGYIRNFYDNKEARARSKLLATTLWFVVVNAVVFSSVLFVFSENISSMLFKIPGNSTYVKLIALATAVHSISMVFYSNLMVQQRAKKYVSINIITLLLTLVLKVYFVVFLRLSVTGVLYAQLIGYAVELVMLGAGYFFRNDMYSFSTAKLKSMFVFSVPLILPQITFWLLNLGDRFFLQLFRTSADVGVYSLGMRFASVIPLIALLPLKAWGPYIFSIKDDEAKCKQTIERFLRAYIAGITILVLIVSLFSKEVIMIMADEAFWPAWKVVYLLCLTQLLVGVINVTAFVFHITRKTWLMSKIEVFAALFSFVLNIVVINYYGMMGAAITKTSAYLLIFCVYVYYIQKVYPISFNYLKIAGILSASALINYFTFFIEGGMATHLTIKLIFIIGFVIILLMSSYFDMQEKEKIKSFLNELIRGLNKAN